MEFASIDSSSHTPEQGKKLDIIAIDFPSTTGIINQRTVEEKKNRSTGHQSSSRKRKKAIKPREFQILVIQQQRRL